MTKRIKWAITLILAAVMAVSVGILAACSNKDVKVTGVTLDQTEATLEVGKTLQLTATVEPENAKNKNVTWSVDLDDYATVDQNGLVTGKAIGFVTVTAKTEDGELTAKCDIQVIEAKGEIIYDGTDEIAGVTRSLTIYGNGTFDLSGAVTNMAAVDNPSATLEIRDVTAAEYKVENNMFIVVTASPVVATAFPDFAFPILINLQNDNGNLILTMYVNNGNDLLIGDFNLTAEQAAALGIDPSKLVPPVPATAITIEETKDLDEGITLDLDTLVTVTPADANTKRTYTIVSQTPENAVVSLNGSKVKGEGAGTAVIKVEQDGHEDEITVTVKTPANPFTNPVYFTETLVVKTRLNAFMLSTLTFTPSITIPGLGSADGAVVEDHTIGSTKGYYTLVKNGETITSVKVFLYENAQNLEFTYTETDNLIKLTDKHTDEDAIDYGTYVSVKNAATTTFEYETMFHYDLWGAVTQDYTFYTDGTYDFVWVVPSLTGGAPTTVHEFGIYSYTSGKLTTEVIFTDFTDKMSALNALDVTTEEGKLVFTADNDVKFVEVVGEAFEAETIFSAEVIVDLRPVMDFYTKTTYTFTFKADGTYTAVLKQFDKDENCTSTVTDSGKYAVYDGNKITCRVEESDGTGALENASKGTFTITEQNGKKQFTVGAYTLVEQVAE